MNLAVRGIDIRWNSEGSFHKEELPDLRTDYIFAKPNNQEKLNAHNQE